MSKAVMISLACMSCMLQGQSQPVLHFNKVTVADGLNDGRVETIAQDVYGYLWVSTLGGINRYNGNDFNFYNRVYGKDGMIPKSICRTIVSDSSGRLFFGFENCLAEFDFQRRQLRKVEALQDNWVFDIMSLNDTSMFIVTYNSWVHYNPMTQKVTPVKNYINDSLASGRLLSGFVSGGKMYYTNRNGMYAYTISTGKTETFPYPEIMGGGGIITTDYHNNIWKLQWPSNGLIKYHLADSTITTIPLSIGSSEFRVNDMVATKDGRLWFATVADGLYQYDPLKGSLYNYRFDPFKPWTINGNLISELFTDRDNLLWVAGESGMSYCDPGNALFQIIAPFATNAFDRNRQVARVVAEDKRGNLWFGTTDGVSVVDSTLKQLMEFNNRPGKPSALYYNSVRGVVCDDDGSIWIATGRGVNRWNWQTKTMEFLGKNDSLIQGFYFGAFKDRKGNIWLCCRDGAGLYYFDAAQRKVMSIQSHPQLKALVGIGFRVVYEDSKGRYWLGTNGSGLAMWNPADGSILRWLDVAGDMPAIAGSYVEDIKEDAHGDIWLSSFSGLSCVHTKDMSVTSYFREDGLPSNTVSSIGIDKLNRVWVGSASGLVLIDSNRKHFTVFDQQNGLPHVAFNEMSCYTASNGDFIMPTMNGYIRFDPLQYKGEANDVLCYLDGLSVNNNYRTIPLPSPLDSNINLRYFENALTFHLQSPSYAHAGKIWYAYRLKGFEEEWHYTQTPEAVYTNIPGGDYDFEYKAAATNEGWRDDCKKLPLHIGTVFYKTVWFWILSALLMAALLYWFYRNQIRQQHQLHTLAVKAKALEKEKAEVMYANLKEHLNPHFMFNSLASLGSLIRIDQEQAGNFLDTMSRIYRYILRKRDVDLVPLAEELDFAESFIQLQQARFEEGLQVSIDVDEDDLPKQIAPVTLQNLLENAIKHNTTSKTKPLQIFISVEDDYLIVRNNLQRKTFVETSNHQGLKKMKSLYSYMSDRPFSWEENDQYFTVKIPLL